MSFVVLPIAQAELVRKALAQLDGLSRRAVVTLDGVANLALTSELGAALDTTQCVEEGDRDDTLECFDLPQELEKHLGQTVTVDGEPITLPSVFELVDEAGLPESLRAVRQAKRDASLAAYEPTP